MRVKFAVKLHYIQLHLGGKFIKYFKLCVLPMMLLSLSVPVMASENVELQSQAMIERQLSSRVGEHTQWNGETGTIISSEIVNVNNDGTYDVITILQHDNIGRKAGNISGTARYESTGQDGTVYWSADLDGSFSFNDINKQVKCTNKSSSFNKTIKITNKSITESESIGQYAKILTVTLKFTHTNGVGASKNVTVGLRCNSGGGLFATNAGELV